MSLRYALLALLTVEPMTGYDLSKEFQSSVGFVWHAPDSQIYPELRRMEKDGLLKGEEIPWGSRGKKKQYRATDAGREALREWISTPVTYSRERDPVHLKVAYLEWAGPKAARGVLQAHIDYHMAQLERYEWQVKSMRSGTNPMLSRRLALSAPENREKVTTFKVFTYEGLIARSQHEIAWGQEGLETLDRLYGDEAVTTGEDGNSSR